MGDWCCNRVFTTPTGRLTVPLCHCGPEREGERVREGERERERERGERGGREGERERVGEEGERDRGRERERVANWDGRGVLYASTHHRHRPCDYPGVLRSGVAEGNTPS